MSNIVHTKKCSKCGKEKDLSEFSKLKKSKKGVQSQCKQCKSIMSIETEIYMALQSRLLEYGYKKCSKCGDTKKIIEFGKNKSVVSGYSAQCKSCLNERTKKYVSTHKEQRKETQKKYNKSDKRKECDDRYKSKYPDRITENSAKFRTTDKYKEYVERRRGIVSERAKERRLTDVEYKIRFNLRVRVNKAVKSRGVPRFYKFDEYIGCTPEFLCSYLESKFTEGMSWDNYTHSGWHIDHIRPCASFDLTDPQQQRECFHYTNLQPLWAHDNVVKSAKILTNV